MNLVLAFISIVWLCYANLIYANLARSKSILNTASHQFYAKSRVSRQSPASFAFEQSLYKSDDPIVQLNLTSFNRTIINADSAFLVEFYASWCGHCRAFAPTYVRLAKTVQGWSEVVKVAAINCAVKAHEGLCQENGVEYFPYLKVNYHFYILSFKSIVE